MASLNPRSWGIPATGSSPARENSGSGRGLDNVGEFKTNGGGGKSRSGSSGGGGGGGAGGLGGNDGAGGFGRGGVGAVGAGGGGNSFPVNLHLMRRESDSSSSMSREQVKTVSGHLHPPFTLPQPLFLPSDSSLC